MSITIDPTRSGELLFRTRFPHKTDDAILSRVSLSFVDLLGKRDRHLHPDKKVTVGRLDHLTDLASRLRSSRISTLQAHVTALQRFLDVHKRRITMTNQRLDQLRSAVVRRVDRYLTEIVLRTFAILEKQGEYQARKMQEAGRLVRRHIAQQRASFELKLFAVHLEEETAGGVTLRQLDHGNAQFLRCRRAALENVKKGFFTPTSRYQGIHVLNVFKIEHKVLLHKFQKRAAQYEAGKVKGLFTALPPGSVSRVCAFGMLNGEPTPMERGAVFRGTTVAAALLSSGDSGVPTVAPEFEGRGRVFERGGLAQRQVDAAAFPAFPRAFSRYSTLDSEKPFVHAPQDRVQFGPTREEELAGDPTPPVGCGFFGDLSDENSDFDGDSQVRYLALCRVIVGNVHVLPKQYDGFPPTVEDGFDTVYNPTAEEYMLLNHRNVLPEFLVQLKYLRDTGEAVGADAIPAPTEQPPTRILACDLSGPTTDWADSGTFDLEPGVSAPSGLLSTLSLVPVLTEGERGTAPSSSRAGALPRRPSFSSSVTGSTVPGLLDAADARENRMVWSDLKLNAERQRDSLMDAVDRLTSQAWSYFPFWAKTEGAVHPPDATKSRRAHLGVSESATIEDLEQEVHDARQQLSAEQRRRLELQHKARGDKRRSRR